MRGYAEGISGLWEKEEYIILPVQAMELLLALEGQNQEVYLPAESIFPPGYTGYLEKVLNSNRHLSTFAYSYIQEDPIGIRGIWQIAKCQIAGMRMGNRRCFQSVMCVERNSEVVGIVLNPKRYDEKDFS